MPGKELEPTPSDSVTLTEAATIANRSTDSIRRAIRSGRLVAEPRQSNYEPLRVNRLDLDKWIKTTTEPGASHPDSSSSSTIATLEAQLAEAITRAERAEEDAATARQLAEAERGRADAERGRADAEAKRAETLTAIYALSAANQTRQPWRWWRKPANPSA